MVFCVITGLTELSEHAEICNWLQLTIDAIYDNITTNYCTLNYSHMLGSDTGLLYCLGKH